MALNSIGVEFVFTNSDMNTKLNKELDSNLYFHGISFSEFKVMYYLNLALNKTMRRIDLAQSVGLSASGVTRLIAPMVKNNILEKEKNSRDARVSLVKLSQTGEKLFNEASISFEHSVKSITNKLSTNQLNTLVELTKKLI